MSRRASKEVDGNDAVAAATEEYLDEWSIDSAKVRAIRSSSSAVDVERVLLLIVLVEEATLAIDVIGMSSKEDGAKRMGLRRRPIRNRKNGNVVFDPAISTLDVLSVIGLLFDPLLVRFAAVVVGVKLVLKRSEVAWKCPANNPRGKVICPVLVVLVAEVELG